LLIRADLKCALVIAGNASNLDEHEADFVYRVGIEMADREWNIGINFLSFVMLADSFRTFTSFDKGIADGSLTFRELRYESNQQRLPSIFTPSIIEI